MMSDAPKPMDSEEARLDAWLEHGSPSFEETERRQAQAEQLAALALKERAAQTRKSIRKFGWVVLAVGAGIACAIWPAGIGTRPLAQLMFGELLDAVVAIVLFIGFVRLAFVFWFYDD